MSAVELRPAPIGHNHPPPEEEILQLRAEVERLKAANEESIERAMGRMYALMREVDAPRVRRRQQLRKYRQTHKAELLQRQREYRYWQHVERLREFEAVGDAKGVARVRQVMNRDEAGGGAMKPRELRRRLVRYGVEIDPSRGKGGLQLARHRGRWATIRGHGQEYPTFARSCAASASIRAKRNAPDP